MTEEEKEAIEYVEQFIGIEKQYKYKPIKIKTLTNTRPAIQTILNLIQNQDTEINKLNNVIDRMALELYNYANLGLLGICPAEQENGNYNLDLCKMNLADRNCIVCIKKYFMKEDK